MPLSNSLPKHAVSQVVGHIKGKSAIHMASWFMEELRADFVRTDTFGAEEVLRQHGRAGRGGDPRLTFANRTREEDQRRDSMNLRAPKTRPPQVAAELKGRLSDSCPPLCSGSPPPLRSRRALQPLTASGNYVAEALARATL